MFIDESFPLHVHRKLYASTTREPHQASVKHLPTYILADTRARGYPCETKFLPQTLATCAKLLIVPRSGSIPRCKVKWSGDSGASSRHKPMLTCPTEDGPCPR